MAVAAWAAMAEQIAISRPEKTRSGRVSAIYRTPCTSPRAGMGSMIAQPRADRLSAVGGRLSGFGLSAVGGRLSVRAKAACAALTADGRWLIARTLTADGREPTA